ncbi:hypothetical protein PPEP_a1725 [Pseudoalteromonas peptidolytica F12-50-A1]|uniref:Uncharacterized protein n=1 Tax=Pseudoalteromonas peptidolytica F12-50-A1 TaxID=1315280 RepID=A0A8I0MWP8_9GAMM|nr:hypothetical protein [Pseudoalteromonas peptidolytica F12-50-A1]
MPKSQMQKHFVTGTVGASLPRDKKVGAKRFNTRWPLSQSAFRSCNLRAEACLNLKCNSTLLVAW